MKIFVHAKPAAREEKVVLRQAQDENGVAHYEVWVKEPPVQGRANAAIQKALAEYFNTAPSMVRLASGYTSRQKVFEIN